MRTAAALLLLATLFAVAAIAAPPNTINYQGYLRNGDGTPVSGSVSIGFSLYDVETGGTSLWSETQTVTPANGVYSVALGSVTSLLAIAFDKPYYLGVRVGSDPEATPRQALTSVPYARRAAVADGVADGNVSLLDATQTVTGIKSFNPSSGTVPFAVDASRTGMVANLNAEMVGGKKIVDLDGRYLDPAQPKATSQQIAMLRWDQVRGGDLNINVGDQPSAIAFDGTSIWVASMGSNSVTRINPATGAIVNTYSIGSLPEALAFDGTSMWLSNSFSNNVARFSPVDGSSTTYSSGEKPAALVYDGDNIWVTNYNIGIVRKLNPADGTILGSYPVGANPSALAYDGTNIWVANYGSNSVMRLNPSDGAVVGSSIGVGTNPSALAFDGTSIWVANWGSNSVTKIKPSDGSILGTYPVGTSPRALAFDGSGVWVANWGANNVMKLDPANGGILGTITVGGNPRALTFDGASIWVANFAGNSVTRLTTSGLPVGPLTVGTSGLQSGAVTTSALAYGAVTSDRIGGTIAASKLDLSTVVRKTGDTMGGPLNLPSNGLVVGTNQLVATGGRVGIGTATPSEQLEITGNLRLPATTATTGIIRSGANPLIHTYGSNNFFAGANAGNFTMSGGDNTASGAIALRSNTTGYANTASGAGALYNNTTGNLNTAIGQNALVANTTGSNNTASGEGALQANSSGNRNTADGFYALGYNSTASANTALGFYAGMSTNYSANANTTGSNNTFIGAYSGPGVASSTPLTNATAIGYQALVNASNSLVLGGTGAYAVKVGIGTAAPAEALDVVGNVRVSGDLKYSTAKTRYLVVHNAAFIPDNSGVTYSSGASYRYITGGGAGAKLRAPVQFPENATIKDWYCLVTDGSALYNVSVTLNAYVWPGDSTAIMWGTATSSGSSVSFYQIGYTPTGIFSTSNTMGYFLEFANNSACGGICGLVSCRIRYEVTQAN